MFCPAKPRRGDTAFGNMFCAAPCGAWRVSLAEFPGLKPGAIICRPFGTKKRNFKTFMSGRTHRLDTSAWCHWTVADHVKSPFLSVNVIVPEAFLPRIVPVYVQVSPLRIFTWSPSMVIVRISENFVLPVVFVHVPSNTFVVPRRTHIPFHESPPPSLTIHFVPSLLWGVPFNSSVCRPNFKPPPSS